MDGCAIGFCVFWVSARGVDTSDVHAGVPTFGIVDVQEFYDLNIDDLINGTIKDANSGLSHHSEKKLSFQEVLMIAEVAKSSKYFDRHVQWLESALSIANNIKWIKKLQKMVKNAKSMHDKVYKSVLVSLSLINSV